VFTQLRGLQFRDWLDESRKVSLFSESPAVGFSTVKDFLAQVGKTKLYEEVS
jgi:hypothetical protein